MIYREIIWKDDKISVTEVIPHGPIPEGFKPYRLRLQVQAMHPQLGPQQKHRDITLNAEFVADALDEAAGMAARVSKEMMAEIEADVRKATQGLVVPASVRKQQVLAKL